MWPNLVRRMIWDHEICRFKSCHSDLKKENFLNPLRFERKVRLRVPITTQWECNKVMEQPVNLAGKSSLVRIVGTELLKRVYAVLLIWICGPVPSV